MSDPGATSVRPTKAAAPTAVDVPRPSYPVPR